MIFSNKTIWEEKMRKFVTAAVAALTLAVTAPASLLADGHGWKPEGPIKMIIAFRAGGGADTQARLIAEELENRHGWQVIPEQITGKGGANAAAALKEEPADGTAIAMIITETLGYNMVAAKNAPYSVADFTPITTTAGTQMGVVLQKLR
jgi:tripartite-type tricarboxylate transporter receptor subunit TctC